MFYNPERKQHFLDNVGENALAYIFAKIGLVEEYYKTDVCDFSYEQIETALYKLESRSVNLLGAALRTLEEYFQFCVDNNYVKENKINLFNLIGRSSDDLSRFIDKDARDNMFVSLKELDTILATYSLNASDDLLLRMLWEGFGGKELSEIRFLKKSDLLDDYKINVRNEKEEIVGQRKISKRLYIAIKDASTETIYEKLKFGDSTRLITHQKDLFDSPYVLRMVRTGKAEMPYFSNNALYLRYKRLVTFLDLRSSKIDELNVSGIVYLGLLLKYAGHKFSEVDFYKLLNAYLKGSTINSTTLRNKISHYVSNERNMLKTEEIDLNMIDVFMENLLIAKEKVQGEPALPDFDHAIELLDGLKKVKRLMSV